MELPFLQLSFTGKKLSNGSDEMRFQMKGDPILLAKAIRTVMQARQDIAAAIMAAVIDYCQQEGIDCGELSKMVTFK